MIKIFSLVTFKGYLKIKSSKKRRLKNTVCPQKNVKSHFDFSNTHENVSVEFSHYTNWMKYISFNKKFNNFYKNSNEACFVAYTLLSELIPFLKEHGNEIVANGYKHCHVLKGKERELARA